MVQKSRDWRTVSPKWTPFPKAPKPLRRRGRSVRAEPGWLHGSSRAVAPVHSQPLSQPKQVTATLNPSMERSRAGSFILCWEAAGKSAAGKGRVHSLYNYTLIS